jgi:hypothetical protein
VQHGEDHRDRRDLLGGVLLDRDATAVVDHLDATVGQQLHRDGVAVAGHRLVHGVVDDLLDEVVQTTLAGRADVHAGPLADGLQALQDGDRIGVVVVHQRRQAGRGRRAGFGLVGWSGIGRHRGGLVGEIVLGGIGHRFRLLSHVGRRVSPTGKTQTAANRLVVRRLPDHASNASSIIARQAPKWPIRTPRNCGQQPLTAAVSPVVGSGRCVRMVPYAPRPYQPLSGPISLT